jgi:hypothetical protein
MNHRKTNEVITVSQKMLNFANLPRLKSMKKINEILRPDKAILWNELADDDFEGFASLNDLQDETQQKLAKLMDGGARVRKKILDEVVRATPNASAKASVQGIMVPLPCVPEIVVENAVVMVRNNWLITGAHAAVVFGLLELFVDDAVERLARCKLCSRFYLQTPKLKVACSPECKRKLRLKDVARNVGRYRKEQRRKRV